MKEEFNKLQYLNLLKRHKKEVVAKPKLTVDKGATEEVKIPYNDGTMVSHDGLCWTDSSGTKFYINGIHDTIHQYTLNTPWDISSASFEFDSNSPFLNPISVSFNKAAICQSTI